MALGGAQLGLIKPKIGPNHRVQAITGSPTFQQAAVTEEIERRSEGRRLTLTNCSGGLLAKAVRLGRENCQGMEKRQGSGRQTSKTALQALPEQPGMAATRW